MYNLREGIFKLFIAFSILNATDPAPPLIPEVQAIKNHEKITLMWDSKAENSIDPLTGYSDFAGYRETGLSQGDFMRKPRYPLHNLPIPHIFCQTSPINPM